MLLKEGGGGYPCVVKRRGGSKIDKKGLVLIHGKN